MTAGKGGGSHLGRTPQPVTKQTVGSELWDGGVPGDGLLHPSLSSWSHSTSRGTEPAPGWDEMSSTLPCFCSASCFLCDLPGSRPGCFCGSRDTVSQHCPAAPKATASLPHRARTWSRNTDSTPKAQLQSKGSFPGAKDTAGHLQEQVLVSPGFTQGDHKGPLQWNWGTSGWLYLVQHWQPGVTAKIRVKYKVSAQWCLLSTPFPHPHLKEWQTKCCIVVFSSIVVFSKSCGIFQALPELL